MKMAKKDLISKAVVSNFIYTKDHNNDFAYFFLFVCVYNLYFVPTRSHLSERKRNGEMGITENRKTSKLYYNKFN